MKKLSLALAIGVAALALLAGLATAFPFAAIFLRVARESLMPQVIGWDAKNGWAKCDGAIGGTVADASGAVLPGGSCSLDPPFLFIVRGGVRL